MSPRSMILMMIWSMAALDGAHTMIFYLLLAIRVLMIIEMMPMMVWVFPVPGGPYISITSSLGISMIFSSTSDWLVLYLPWFWMR